MAITSNCFDTVKSVCVDAALQNSIFGSTDEMRKEIKGLRNDQMQRVQRVVKEKIIDVPLVIKTNRGINGPTLLVEHSVHDPSFCNGCDAQICDEVD